MEETKENCSFVQVGPVSNTSSVNHQHEHGHTHEVMDGPGRFEERDKPLTRTNWKERAFTIGIGGPVGSGKTALVLALCQYFRRNHSICVVTNDIFTREDWEFLVRNKALPEERMRAVETGGCPHAAIREDYSSNMAEVRELTLKFDPQLVIIESGGDNLAANFSRELADYIIYVIDVAVKMDSDRKYWKSESNIIFILPTCIGGDKVPRKGGPGITQSDLLIINKTDLAEAVGADLEVMKRDAYAMRGNGPTIFAQTKHNVGIPEIAQLILNAERRK